MYRFLLLLLCAGLLTACPVNSGSGDDDDSGTDDDDTSSGDDDDAAGFLPEEGTWSLTLDDLIEDSCDAAPGAGSGDSLGNTTLTLLDGGADGFVMVDSDDQTFRCDFDAGSDVAFSCTADEMDLGSPDSTFFPNITIKRNGTRAGTFLAADEARLSLNVNTDTCEGAECGTYEQTQAFTFPCVFEFSADADR